MTEGMLLWVEQSWLDVEVVPDPYQPERWVFDRMKETVKWKTHAGKAPGPGKLVQPTTFGGIKSMYK